jgi:nitrogen regulatory protein PII
MKTITIVAERVTDQALAAAVPARGVASVKVRANRADVVRGGKGDAATITGYQSFRNPSRFNPAVRIDLLVDDDAVETVFDGVSFAYAAGIFSDAEMWVEAPALALTA